ncbi:hypothetical protein K505DRAFT_322868 [Melanomma pulvis-pyrius CBS 109.77]|uniref:RBR-type E3 ubiquitin transferase n=1 Tax=Melanomma pulvis-pyrius CBS 109.77 TaxID=1314802 RepID=A0A6A6XLM7_9PLEO|nr:hypothetical protein K505DRAFT_322868 [Melanomma pulvis-pyrius CBS 109.77]
MGQSLTSLLDPGVESWSPSQDRATHRHRERTQSRHSTNRSKVPTAKHGYVGAHLRSTPRPRTSAHQTERSRRHRDKRSTPLTEVDVNARRPRQATASAWDIDQRGRDIDGQPRKTKPRDGKHNRPHRNRDSKAESQHKDRTSESGKRRSHTHSHPDSQVKHRRESKSQSEAHVEVTEIKKPREKKDCMVCAESLSVHRFPQRPPTAQCEHGINTCRHCLRGWIRSEFKSKVWDQLDCPECRARMEYDDVKQFAPPEVFRQYDRLSTRAALEAIPGFRWCIAKGCKSGQVHDGWNSTPRFRCVACKASHCVAHQIPWHRKETCAQYDYRTDSKIKKAEDSASRKLIKELAKKCPGCKWNIEKNNGCDHMTCSKCRHEFCWLCLAPWGPIRNQGSQMHHPSCSLYSDGADGVNIWDDF